jgi:hypothetical protein
MEMYPKLKQALFSRITGLMLRLLIEQVGDGVPIGKRIADNSYLYRDIIDGVQIEVIKQGNNVIAGYPTGGGTIGLPTGFTSK